MAKVSNLPDKKSNKNCYNAWHLFNFSFQTLYLTYRLSMNTPEDEFTQVINKLTPEIYQRMRTSIEIGKWPDGRVLSQDQKEHAMRAIIAYEMQNKVDEQERVGFVNVKGSDCHEEDGAVKANNLEQPKPIKWK